MKSAEVRRKYIDFFKARGHVEIPSSSLVPENDPTTLFNSSGMQPLVPYLLGQSHPSGKRLVNSQKAIRLQDIEEIGDNRHTTFFEMLGNWSLGDPASPGEDASQGGYFKKEQLPWIFEFLTSGLGLDPKRLYVSVFEGNDSVPKDSESIALWKQIFSGVGIDAKEGDPSSAKALTGEGRIFAYPAKKNWWSRSGEPENMPPGEPGGPDSEVFFDFGKQLKFHENSPFKDQPCHPNCDCGRFMEIANSVFMQYQKPPFAKASTSAQATADRSEGQAGSGNQLIELKQKNVDFGGGLERMVAASVDAPDVFKSDLFTPIISVIEHMSGKTYGLTPAETKAIRIVADHIKGSVMLISDGVLPSNKLQGYVLRRLIRRSLLYAKKIGLSDWKFVGKLVDPVGEIYQEAYPCVAKDAANITKILEEEALRFGKTLEKGLKEIEKAEVLDGKLAFMFYETYGFPWEMTEEIARERGQNIDRKQFEEEFEKHKQLSRSAAAGMFKGGLADHSEQTTKLHTATHLLHQALRTVLGSHVSQKGSNITVERLRFDFSHTTKLTPAELKKVEDMVNEQIKKDIPVSFEILDKAKALQSGALAFFGDRYGEQVKVYTMGNFSKEICGGPHVDHTGALGRFTILKEESPGAGIRRIYATVG